ncbi:GntR family transcriptional regulator [Streptomyces sp. NPDC093108]|uniref:GntR family transcriptional regulator n=1 Tax=Streptomyces sp. NPDC093108 TaxID=3366030 RepID=UPI0038016511
MASYRDVAELIRQDVAAGTWAADRPIPGIDKLRDRYGVARETAHRAVKALVAEGLLYSIPRRGTYIRPPLPAPTRIRDRQAYRDEIGYFFDLGAQDWRAVGPAIPPQVGVPPSDVADVLGVARKDHVMVRDRAIGPPDADLPEQLATSYLPMPLVGQLPILGAPNTGPGGIYDRIEEHFGKAIEWEETVSARPATAHEQQALRIGSGLPVLIITRTSRIDDHQVVEVNQTRMAADRYSVSYGVRRSESAVFPRPSAA